MNFRKELNKIYQEYASSDWDASLFKIKEILEYDWNKKLFVTIQSLKDFNNVEIKRVEEKIVNLSIYNRPQMCYTPSLPP